MSQQPTSPAVSAGTTAPAGEGVGDGEMVDQVESQTAPDLAVEPIFRSEADGGTSEGPVEEVGT